MSDVDAYRWEIGQPPPILHLHSLAKHRVLEAYLERYVEVLASDPRIDILRLDVVDGMCGGGIYTREDNGELCDGSPLIFLRSLKAAEAKINILRRKEFKIDVRFFFVDSEKKNIEFLRNELENTEFVSQIDDTIFLIADEFSNVVSKVTATIRDKRRTGRSIFLLDQYGYSDVPFPMLRSLLSSLPKIEILLTFGTDALINFMNDSPSYEKALLRLGITKEQLSDMAELRKLKLWRYFVQAKLSESLHTQSGARFFTPFFIRSRQSHRAYWFIHLSQEVKARDEMVGVHWQHHSNFVHYGGAGLNMLGYDPAHDEALTNQSVFEFDENAEVLSLNTLKDDLLQHIFGASEPRRFIDLVTETANGTPATQDLIKHALNFLQQEGDLQILTPTGASRRSVLRTTKNDLIVPRKQLRLDLKPPQK